MSQPSDAPAAPQEPKPPDELLVAVHFVVLAFAIYLLQPLCTTIALGVLRESGFYAWYYGPQIVEQALGEKGPAQQAAQLRLTLWAIAAAFPFWLTALIVLLWRLPAAYRRDMGVAWGRFAGRTDLVANFLLGIAAWPVLTALALAVNYLVIKLHDLLGPWPQEEHPFTQLALTGGMRPAEWVLMGFSAVVWAPLGEELYFRGVLLALFRKLRGSSRHAAMMLAVAAVLVVRRQQLVDAVHQGGTRPLLLAGLPVLFAVALLPIYALVCRFSRTVDGPVIFGTALLFAAVHTTWPTPVALFVLALGLGWLAVWSRSLIAPIVVHSLFNLLSYWQLLFG